MQRYYSTFLVVTFFIALLWGIPTSEGTRFMKGDGYLSFKNLHLNETVYVRYRNSWGNYNKSALKTIQRGLRCRSTNEEHKISVEVLETVDAIQDHFGVDELHIISGYRSPSFNESLRRSGHKVAKQSLHTYGLAMDIRIPGVSTWNLRQYAISLERGGVGYYPGRNFVHIDAGRFRIW